MLAVVLRSVVRRAGAVVGAAAMLCTAAAPAEGQVPAGYELIEIRSSDETYDSPRLNNCGEIVIGAGPNGVGSGELYLYDNGALQQLTDNDVPEGLADINDGGTIALTFVEGGFSGRSHVALLTGGVMQVLGLGEVPSINALGEVACYRFRATDCRIRCDVWYFDGSAYYELYNDGWSNQSIRLNDEGQLAWTRYYFCEQPWRSDVVAYRDGVAENLPTMDEQAQSPTLNNLGVVMWSEDDDVLRMLIDDQAVLFTDDGDNARINDRMDVYFIRWNKPNAAWDSWLYLAERNAFYHLAGGQEWNTDGDINEYGECTWRWLSNPNFGPILPMGVRMLRRVRNGDLNFDTRVDLADHAGFLECLIGPGDFDRLCHCRFADMAHDRDVDLGDFALLQNAFGFGQDCCSLGHGPGCNDHAVQACVCELSPQCCTTDWDASCVLLVDLLGCGDCL